MGDVVSTIGTAITLTKRLREISKKIEDAEFKNLLADLSLELADAKLKIAELMEQNADLMVKVRSLESLDSEPCPKCRKRTWELISSAPDKVFGRLGGTRRNYRCSECNHSESMLHTPKR